ncbi:hypothetical protein [Streptomyces sp. NPDC050121]|uniref:hypothetical protein n=1 Tax=Streptomyces sp. NPDC050121 TaxID=3365601 RepID=UPI0037A4B5B4
MTTVNKVFPEVSTAEELAGVEAIKFVECSRCVDLTPITDGVDPVEWARKHTALRPWHTTFRTHSIKNFSVPEPSTEPDEPVIFPWTRE